MPDGATGHEAIVESLLEKLRSFLSELDDDERAMITALLEPGVRALMPVVDVEGFMGTMWSEDMLRRALERAAQQLPDQD